MVKCNFKKIRSKQNLIPLLLKPTHLNKDDVNFSKYGKDKPIVCMGANVVRK